MWFLQKEAVVYGKIDVRDTGAFVRVIKQRKKTAG